MSKNQESIKICSCHPCLKYDKICCLKLHPNVSKHGNCPLICIAIRMLLERSSNPETLWPLNPCSLTAGTWRSTLGKEDSYWKPSFSGVKLWGCTQCHIVPCCSIRFIQDGWREISWISTANLIEKNALPSSVTTRQQVYVGGFSLLEYHLIL